MESSLDRFARTRGAALLGAAAMGRQWKIQAGVGAALLAAGGLLASLPHFGADPGVAFGAVGPTLAGVINFGLGIGFRHKALQGGPGVGLSDEAGALLRALVARAQVWQGARRRNRGAFQESYHWPGPRAAAPPSASAMEALERGAAAHNRVTDALGGAKDERAARLLAAADAGMGEALHQAATNSDGIEATVVRLEELADLVESALGRPEPVSPLRSNLEATIEELRAEAEAVRELKGL